MLHDCRQPGPVLDTSRRTHPLPVTEFPIIDLADWEIPAFSGALLTPRSLFVVRTLPPTPLRQAGIERRRAEATQKKARKTPESISMTALIAPC